jgi:hypothetical protein
VSCRTMTVHHTPMPFARLVPAPRCLPQRRALETLPRPKRLSAITKLPPPWTQGLVPPVPCLPYWCPCSPVFPSPCHMQGVCGNARTASRINRAHQMLDATLQRLSRLARFISAPLTCGTLVLTHLFDVEDDGHKCW